MDIILSFPQIILSLAAIATVGPKLWLVVATVAITTMPRVARVVRGAALEVVERDFVLAAEAFGESRARILLGDLRAYQAQLCREAGHDVDESTAARLWVIEVVTPTEHLAHAALNHSGTAIQAYCDLLEVRWLLSEQAGRDVGTRNALVALSENVIPTDSAAKMAVAEVPTAPFAVLRSDDDC